jgi:hypothetical protein
MKIKCVIYEKEFEQNFNGFISIFKCPICKKYFRVSFPIIGLSNSCSVEIEDGWHVVVREEKK